MLFPTLTNLPMLLFLLDELLGLEFELFPDPDGFDGPDGFDDPDCPDADKLTPLDGMEDEELVLLSDGLALSVLVSSC